MRGGGEEACTGGEQGAGAGGGGRDGAGGAAEERGPTRRRWCAGLEVGHSRTFYGATAYGRGYSDRTGDGDGRDLRGEAGGREWHGRVRAARDGSREGRVKAGDHNLCASAVPAYDSAAAPHDTEIHEWVITWPAPWDPPCAAYTSS